MPPKEEEFRARAYSTGSLSVRGTNPNSANAGAIGRLKTSEAANKNEPHTFSARLGTDLPKSEMAKVKINSAMQEPDAMLPSFWVQAAKDGWGASFKDLGNSYANSLFQEAQNLTGGVASSTELVGDVVKSIISFGRSAKNAVEALPGIFKETETCVQITKSVLQRVEQILPSDAPKAELGEQAPQSSRVSQEERTRIFDTPDCSNERLASENKENNYTFRRFFSEKITQPLKKAWSAVYEFLGKHLSNTCIVKWINKKYQKFEAKVLVKWLMSVLFRARVLREEGVNHIENWMNHVTKWLAAFMPTISSMWKR